MVVVGVFLFFMLIALVPPTKADETTTWTLNWYEALTSTGTFGSTILGTSYWSDTFDHDWSTGNIYGSRPDYTGFKATATVYAHADMWVVFTVGSDDGFRFYVDNLLNASYEGIRTYSTNSQDVYLTKGTHTLELDYYDWTGYARVSFAVDDESIFQQHSPTLSSSYLNLSSGSEQTTFTYRVTYTDTDGAEASYVYAVINGSSHSMTKVSGTPTTGVLYEYSTTGNYLNAGTNSYYFRASDGIDATTTTSSSGPTVTKSTTLSVSPSSFSVSSGGTQTLTPALTSGSSTLTDQTITWGATVGSFSGGTGTSLDAISSLPVTYVAPTVTSQTSVTITASFAGYTNYYTSSSANSAGTISTSTTPPSESFTYTFTFTKPGGSALANTTIDYTIYGTSYGTVVGYLGVTDSSGNITSTDSTLANNTVYFTSLDGKYSGYASVGSTGGTASVSTTETPSSNYLPVLLLIGGIAVVGVIMWKKVLSKPKHAKHATETGQSKNIPIKPAHLSCPHCKSKLPADADFCHECGKKVKS